MDAEMINANIAASLTLQHDQMGVSVIRDTSAQDHGREGRAARGRGERVGFLDLPFELRLQIYGNVISNIQPRRIGYGVREDPDKAKLSSVYLVHLEGTDPTGCRNPLTILRTCRQVYQEVKYDLHCRRQLIERAQTFELDSTIQISEHSSRKFIEPRLFPTTTLWPTETVQRIQVNNPTDSTRRFDGDKLRMILKELAVNAVPDLVRALPSLEVVNFDLNIRNVYGNPRFEIDPEWISTKRLFDTSLVRSNVLLFNDEHACVGERPSPRQHGKRYGWFYTVPHFLRVQVFQHKAVVFESVDGRQAPFGNEVPRECADRANRWFNEALHKHLEDKK